MHDEQEDEARRQREAQAEQLREQREALQTDEQRREAVQIVQDMVRRQAARMGKTVSDDVMHRVEERAQERFERDPRMVDQVRIAEAKRLKEAQRDGGDELRGLAAEVRREHADVRHARQADHRDRLLQLRLQQQQTQEHHRADHERERVR